MSKLVKGLLIALGIIVVIGVLAFIGFEVYAMLGRGHVAGAAPFVRPGFGYGRFGIRGGLIPYRSMFPYRGLYSLVGIAFLALLAALVIAALMAPGGRSSGRVCARCGRDLEMGWVACPHCGQMVEAAAPTAATTSPAPSETAPKGKGRSRGGASA